MALRVALSHDGEAIELTLPTGHKTVIRPEGHAGALILTQLKRQRAAELMAAWQLGHGGADWREEVEVPPVQVLKKKSPKIQGRTAPTLDELDL